MGYKIAPEIISEIDVFLKQISVAHNLDSEIREELRSHIEDKLCGYMKGEIKITEEEAWLLVREHFGDPSVLKNQYYETEANAMYNIYFRRAGAAFLVCMGLMFIAPPLLEALFRIMANIFFINPMNYFTTSIYCAGLGMKIILPVILMVYLFYVWRKKMNNNEVLWFETISKTNFIKLIVVTFIATITVKMLFENENFSLIPWHKVTFLNTDIERMFYLLGGRFIYVYLYGIIPPLVSCFAWLWWSDIPPKRYLAVFYGFITWMSAQIVIVKTFVFIHTVSNPIFYTSHSSDFNFINFLFNVTFSPMRLEIYFKYGTIALVLYFAMYFAYKILNRKEALMIPSVN